jgi:hypothetical protein
MSITIIVFFHPRSPAPEPVIYPACAESLKSCKDVGEGDHLQSRSHCDFMPTGIMPSCKNIQPFGMWHISVFGISKHVQAHPLQRYFSLIIIASQFYVRSSTG